MSNSRKLFLLIPALVFILACQLISQPIQQVQDGAATAVSIATDAGILVTEMAGVATQVIDAATQAAPLGTLVANPTSDPNMPLGDVFHPSKPPLEMWKDIPVMPGAIAGDEAEGMYGYTVDATPQEVEDYYNKRLPPFGWIQAMYLPYSDGMGLMMFGRADTALTITIADVDGTTLVLLTVQR